MSWDPHQYNRFKQQREAPFEDLMKWLVVRPGLKAVDLGCGTGELTGKLAERIPGSHMLGLDSSPEMLSQAVARPGLEFRQQPLEELEGSFDLIFSHAALHWVGDHEALFERLWSRLRPGGQILVQMPANFDHVSHRLAGDIAARLGLERRVAPVLQPEQYADLLFRLGATEIEVVLKVYPHVLPDADSVVEWTKGTLLTAYLPQLSESGRAEFLSQYARELRAALPGKPVFYGFKRLLLGAKSALPGAD